MYININIDTYTCIYIYIETTGGASSLDIYCIDVCMYVYTYITIRLSPSQVLIGRLTPRRVNT